MADLTLPSTDEWRDRYLRDFKLWQQDADTSRGTQPYIDAVTFAGQMPTLLKNGSIAAERALIFRTFGDELDDYGTDHGHPRDQGKGSFGTVAVQTGSTGATYTNGATLKHKDTGEPYRFVGATGAYANGASLAVESIGIGRQTNLPPGSVLVWDSPPAGSLPNVTVEGVDGRGLIGGADVETDADYQRRLVGYLSDPPADGNEGHYIYLVEEGNHGVPVKKAFVFPAILGPGTVGVTFTIRASGAGKIPTAPQLAAVETFLQSGVVPFGDGIFMIALSADTSSAAQRPILGVKFLASQTGFLDPDPFPRRDLPVGVLHWKIHSSPTPTATTFGVVSSTGTYTGSGIRVGQTMAVWNGASFVRKKILSFTGTGPYTITIDTSAGSSDAAYTPVAGQYVCPWSDKLSELAQAVVDHYDTLGPGESTSSIPDPGSRMARFPVDSILDPYGVTSRVTVGLAARADIQSVTVHAGLVAAPAPGTPGVSAKIFTLDDLAFYPLT